jgi:hypothetical protein
MTGLHDIKDLRVPRWYGFPKGTVVTLSSCSDASDTGYGAASYFHAPSHETAFVAAKGKVIGKRLSTRRSELQALVVICRLTKTILKETEEVVNVGKIVFWVDSTAVYFWVKNVFLVSQSRSALIYSLCAQQKLSQHNKTLQSKTMQRNGTP